MRLQIQYAFTLVELLVVIAIVGILSGLIIVGMSSSVNSARLAKAQVFSGSLRDSLMMNLVSEWKFDEISGTTASESWSGNHDGTLTNFNFDATDGWKNGIYKGCLQFDGTDDYVSVANPGTFLPHRNNFTVEFWMNATTATSQPYRGIIDQGNSNSGTADGWHIWLSNNNIIIFHMGDGTNNLGGVTYSGIKLNTWYHVTLTVDRVLGYTIYIDGVNKAFSSSNSSSYDVGNSNPALYFGRVSWQVDPVDQYVGYLDNIRYYSAAIPASKIKEHHYAGLSRLMSKGEIKMDEYKNLLRSSSL